MLLNTYQCLLNFQCTNIMIDDDDILMHFGGLEQNSLIHILNTIHEDQDTNDEAPVLIRHSSYYNDVKLTNELNNNRDKFNILSLNCESINTKIDEIRLKLAHYKEGGCEFDAICIQETWLSEDSDKSLLCIEDYTLISLGKTCSTRGGLIIYLKENLKYKILDMSLKSNIWEGQFIEIYVDIMCPKKIILGNIYRPPRDINENYRQFIDEFTTVLAKLERSHSDVIIAGDFNIDLLKIHEKPIFGDNFDAITGHSFFPKITLPTRFSDMNGTLIDNFLYKISHRLLKTSASIILSRISDHLPYFVSLDYVNIKLKNVTKFIQVKQQNASNLNNFKAELSRTKCTD